MSVLFWITVANAQESAFYLPKAASTLAEDVDNTFSFIYWCCAVFFFYIDGSNVLLYGSLQRQGS
jgi:hypothetical protein